MKNSLKWLCAALAGLLLASQAQASQSYMLDYRDTQVSNGGALYLKRDLANAYPGLPVQDMDILSVQVETKLFDFQGDVSARVGRYFSQRQGLYGNPRTWNDPSPYSYQNLFFSVPRQESQGPWQLLFNGGTFKVRRVNVELEDRYSPYPPGPGPAPAPGPAPRPGPGPGPGPGYPPPPPPPPSRYVEIQCDSWSYQPSVCPVGFQIQRAEMLQQISTGRGQCNFNSTWFVQGDTIRVTNGCRARFGVWGY